MRLSWSHAVLNVRDLEAMLAFYRDVLGFSISDRGAVMEGGPEIVFLSQQPGEHHQLAMLPVATEGGADGSLNHLAFRVQRFEDVVSLHQRLARMDGAKPGPLSHGNTLSVYFQDPEGNGIEVFWDTPWHVAQPQGKPWDPGLSEAQALAWVEENFGAEPTFEPREAWLARQADEAAGE